jgi:hypothetical protein
MGRGSDRAVPFEKDFLAFVGKNEKQQTLLR